MGGARERARTDNTKNTLGLSVWFNYSQGKKDRRWRGLCGPGAWAALRSWSQVPSLPAFCSPPPTAKPGASVRGGERGGRHTYLHIVALSSLLGERGGGSGASSSP